MPPRTHANNPQLSAAIRSRRESLGLSIETASDKAGIGTKSWSRYESGEAIREDKVRGLCRALGWNRLPAVDEVTDPESASGIFDGVDESHEAWSAAIAERIGTDCAATFAIAYELLMDEADQDLEALSREPRGTHLGQLQLSWLDGSLPPQFVPLYDYEVVFQIRATIESLRRRFRAGDLTAHTVFDELTLYLMLSKAEELSDADSTFYSDDADWRDWLDDLLGDLDVVDSLYSTGTVLTPHMSYHFSHWAEPQFYSTDGALTADEEAAKLLGLLVKVKDE